jgi:actin related protein 2/3 complex subunit 2
MILLEYHNRIILETLTELIKGDKRADVNIVLADFDGVQFHISTKGNSKNLIQVSIQWTCLPVLLQHGAADEIKKIYGNLVQATPEPNYHVTLEFDLDNIPGDKEKFPEAVSLLKRHLLSAPFKQAFQLVEAGKGAGSPVISLEYREEEAIYIKPDKENVLVIFSINFKDAADQTIAKLFLHEFAQNSRSINGSPPVSYSTKEAPLELKGVPGVRETDTHSFVTFVLFKGHFAAKNVDKTINNLSTFRDYLHYHIKCSKALMHDRMRTRVESFKQIINQARPKKGETAKRTADGRTFVKS